jgi:glutaredoxin-related protein
MSYKIIDNFLEKEDFLKFKQDIFGDRVPWFYRTAQTPEAEKDNEDVGYFSLCFYNNFCTDFIAFNYYLNKIYTKLNCRSLIQSRANLFLKRKETNKLSFHVDYEHKDSLTAILYMNTNNGGTILKQKDKEIKIDSIENRALIFNTNTFHASKIQTDEKKRIIININYF